MFFPPLQDKAISFKLMNDLSPVLWGRTLQTIENNRLTKHITFVSFSMHCIFKHLLSLNFGGKGLLADSVVHFALQLFFSSYVKEVDAPLSVFSWKQNWMYLNLGISTLKLDSMGKRNLKLNMKT